MTGLSNGPLADIVAERRRQIEAEGWTPEHDSQHKSGELAIAAACYALNATDGSDGPETRFIGAELWPWADEWWKPTDPRRDLVKAAALIVAEIDRLDRAEGTPILTHEPTIADDLLDALVSIRRFGELANIDAGGPRWGSSGKKPPSKDVWAFPRHMLPDIDALIAKAEASKS